MWSRCDCAEAVPQTPYDVSTCARVSRLRSAARPNKTLLPSVCSSWPLWETAPPGPSTSRWFRPSTTVPPTPTACKCHLLRHHLDSTALCRAHARLTRVYRHLCFFPRDREEIKTRASQSRDRCPRQLGTWWFNWVVMPKRPNNNNKKGQTVPPIRMATSCGLKQEAAVQFEAFCSAFQ